MNAIDAQGFIDNVLKEMWPDWRPTDWQLKAWKNTLLRCHYAESKRAIEDWYVRADRPGRGPVLGIFNKIKVFDSGFRIASREPELLYQLTKLTESAALGRRHNFFGTVRPSDSDIEAQAERDRVRSERLYGGQWVVIRCWEGVKADEVPF